MKEAIFVDTSYLIALTSLKDKNHQTALRIQEKMRKMHNLVQLYYSDYIFDEYITYLKLQKENHNLNHEKIVKLGEAIRKSKFLTYIHISEGIYEKTWEYFKKFQDKEWSFTDTSSLAIMDTFGIDQFLSFDAHFSQFPNKISWS